jgi:hypothetical protein
MSEVDDGFVTTQIELLNKAMESGDIPKIYFNGFVNFLNPSDISMLLQLNNNPVAVVSMSYTVAKTFAAMLGSIIADIEEKTGNKIMTIDYITTALGKK